MRRTVLALASLATLAACGAEPAEPEPADAPSPSGLDQVDELWADIAAARAELLLGETELIIDCLEHREFEVHNVDAMIGAAAYSGPAPSEVLADVGDPTGLPTPEEAETRALGVWLGYAHAYEDQAGIDLEAAEAEDDSPTPEPAADLAAIEAEGEGWDRLPAVEQIEWEIAYQGPEWAASSKTASVLGSDEWAAAGLPGEGWTRRSDLDSSPQGCRGQVLGELHGEPVQHGSDWSWGPRLDVAPALAEPDPDELGEADRFTECLEAAGLTDWPLAEGGGLDYGDHWSDRYLPEAAVHAGDTTEFSTSDITEADRDRYEATKREEFEAAATIASCDTESGYSEAAEREYTQILTEGFLEAVPAYETYLADLRAALASID